MKRLLVALAVALAAAPAARAVDGNLVQNPNFDTDLSNWSNGPGGITSQWDASDVVDNPSSGSAKVTSTQALDGGPGNSGGGLIQCLDIAGSGTPRSFTIGAFYFIPSGQNRTATPDVSVSWFSTPQCGAFAGLPDGKTGLGSPTTDTWTQLQAVVDAPLTAQSLRIFLRPRKVEAAGSIDVLFDAVFLPEPDAAVLGVAAIAGLGLLARRRSIRG
jgi:hypothetical protein